MAIKQLIMLSRRSRHRIRDDAHIGLCAEPAGSPRGGELFIGVPSDGLYRLPYADGTRVKVFDDFQSHRPHGRLDLFAISGERPYAIVAAAAGRIIAIRDNFSEQQSGRAADCRNNFISKSRRPGRL